MNQNEIQEKGQEFFFIKDYNSLLEKGSGGPGGYQTRDLLVLGHSIQMITSL